MGDATGIIGLGPGQGLLKVASVCTFISHRPHHDAEAVFIPLHHSLHPVHDSLFPGRIICQLLIPSAETLQIRVLFSVKHEGAVGFQICLIDHHKPVFITQLIEVRGIGIVAGPDGIKIMLLHQPHIRFQPVNGNGKTGFRIGIMPVHPSELYFLSIEVKNPVSDFHGSESDVIHDRFLLSFHHQGIKIGILCIPEDGTFYFQLQLSILGNASPGHFFPLGVLHDHLRLCLPEILYRKKYFRNITLHRSGDPVISHCLFRPFQNINIPKDAAHAKLILVF